jgi:cbb3-type cytochrome oxidase subunit 3
MNEYKEAIAIIIMFIFWIGVWIFTARNEKD